MASLHRHYRTFMAGKNKKIRKPPVKEGHI